MNVMAFTHDIKEQQVPELDEFLSAPSCTDIENLQPRRVVCDEGSPAPYELEGKRDEDIISVRWSHSVYTLSRSNIYPCTPKFYWWNTVAPQSSIILVTRLCVGIMRHDIVGIMLVL